MTLLDMVDKEDICNALKALGDNKSIPPLLDDYLKTVAVTGKTGFSWELFQPLVLSKFDKVLDEWIQIYPISTFPHHYNGPDKSFTELRSILTERLTHFTNIPYTIQRLCELLIEPKRHYNRPDTYLRALQKVILVVSAVDSNGQTIYNDETLNREHIQGSPASRVAGEDSSFENDENADSDMDISMPMSNNTPHPIWASTTRPTIAFINSPATAKCLKQQAERESALVANISAIPDSLDMDMSDEDLEKPAVSSNVPPIDQMLRPIGQLEAFVQNLAPASADNNSSAVRNVPSSLISPLSSGSTLITQMNASPKPSLMNFGLPSSDLSPTHIRQLATETAISLSEIHQSNCNDQQKSTESAWNKSRKRDIPSYLEKKEEHVPEQDEQNEHQLGDDAEISSQNSSPSDEEMAKPSPRKMSKLDLEQDQEDKKELSDSSTNHTTEDVIKKPVIDSDDPFSFSSSLEQDGSNDPPKDEQEPEKSPVKEHKDPK